MIVEVSLLIAIYSVWILILVNVMVSSEEVSLTIATLPFIITFPLAMILAASLESIFPGIFLADIMLTMIVGILLFVRWIMAIAGE
ncbi:MAG: hypothetical protein ACTSV3_00785 [Candidatus Thorarchaeota archaeon]|nr:MAG: hypothetical protein DRP09_04380 [Candidatus Thorarchaeota archaeon]RLI59727.1 MAG: hypothetical protein DRO87_01960 [Candidatus Thorarchaeota archaeon]